MQHDSPLFLYLFQIPCVSSREVSMEYSIQAAQLANVEIF
jgi:hypothetical protein